MLNERLDLMIIEHDLVLDQYIVWQKSKNILVEKYRGLKKNCLSYVKKAKNKRK